MHESTYAFTRTISIWPHDENHDSRRWAQWTGLFCVVIVLICSWTSNNSCCWFFPLQTIQQTSRCVKFWGYRFNILYSHINSLYFCSFLTYSAYYRHSVNATRFMHLALPNTQVLSLRHLGDTFHTYHWTCRASLRTLGIPFQGNRIRFQSKLYWF